MASIAGFRPWPRWTLTGLFRRVPDAPQTQAAVVAEVTSRRPDLRKRRSYAPARDSYLEKAAMRREMYRL